MLIDCGPCRIREWRAEDRSALLRLADDRRVWRNLTHRFPHPYTGADADFWLDLQQRSTPATNWAIDLDGAAVGGVGVKPGEGVFAKNGEFGYWLGQPYWGRGLMTAVVRVVVEHIFATTELQRLESPVFEWNPASMRVLEKCGFEREAVLRRSVFKDGQLIDAVLYARLR
jgi:[ribosomal protein S5]-alanine N-acetyltransferase